MELSIDKKWVLKDFSIFSWEWNGKISKIDIKKIVKIIVTDIFLIDNLIFFT